MLAEKGLSALGCVSATIRRSFNNPASLDFAYDITAKAPADAQLSPRKDFDSTKITDPMSARFADELKKAELFKFDGADMMPAAIGSGAFWKEATA